MSENNIKALKITHSGQKYRSCHGREVRRGRGFGEVWSEVTFWFVGLGSPILRVDIYEKFCNIITPACYISGVHVFGFCFRTMPAFHVTRVFLGRHHATLEQKLLPPPKKKKLYIRGLRHFLTAMCDFICFNATVWYRMQLHSQTTKNPSIWPRY